MTSRVLRSNWVRSLAVFGALLGIAAIAVAQQPPNRPKRMRPRQRITRGQAVGLLGNLLPIVSKDDMAAMDLDGASGLFPTWQCTVALIPVKSDLLKFPDEKAPVFVVGILQTIEGYSGPFAGLPPGTYVVVADADAGEADVYNFHRRAEPAAHMEMKKQDRKRPSATAKWYLQQRRTEVWYNLLLGDKAYSWPILLPLEKKEEPKAKPAQ